MTARTQFSVLLWGLLMGLAGCIDFEREQSDFCRRHPAHCGTEVAGTDDAGITADSGTQAGQDAGTNLDSGDAGITADSGTQTGQDAGTNLDSGTPDASAPPIGMPSKVVGVYFAAWEMDINIRDITQDANVIYLFNLHPHPGEVGTWYWEWPGWPSQADVQFVRARGQKVILSLGGFGHHFAFNSRAKTQATLNAIRSHIANDFGPVDGIELGTFWGEENGVKRAALSDPAEILWLIQQLRAEYGSGFALTIPPTADYSEDLALATALANNGALTWAAPQFYDWSAFNEPGFISGRMRTWAGAIGQTKLVMGVSANYPNGPTLADCTREWDVVEAEFPNIRGATAWNAQFNHRGGNQWTATMRQRVIGATPSQTTTCSSYASWNSSTRYMPGDMVTRNGQRYVATPASAEPTWNVNSPPELTPSLWTTYRCTN